MHLVLTTGAPTASGHKYADGPGQYEYPKAYSKRMVPGTPFLYYRGRRAVAAGLSGPGYFGCGVVGTVLRSTGNRILSEILDVEEFPELVPLRDPAGAYYEPIGGTRRGYFQTGVRPIEPETMTRVLEAANQQTVRQSAKAPSPKPSGSVPDDRGAGLYGFDAAANAEVERYAVDLTLALLRADPGVRGVTEMPRNNKGYDIRVVLDDREVHVEVKGTRSREPVFLLTEGERLHSHDASIEFMLVVVHAINLRNGTHELTCRRGPVVDGSCSLKPRQWEVRVPRGNPWPVSL
jgi:hypothetical protein